MLPSMGFAKGSYLKLLYLSPVHLSIIFMSLQNWDDMQRNFDSVIDGNMAVLAHTCISEQSMNVWSDRFLQSMQMLQSGMACFGW